jgi:anti-sigma regulatory factor (Ser/Thr protein kinase)
VPTALRITENVSLSSIGALRRRTAAAIAETGVDQELVAAIRLCVSEALANAVVHAYPEHAGLVEIVVELEGDQILLTVRDEGRGLGSGPEARDDRGFGLEIIRNLAEDVSVRSDLGHGTEIRMAFVPGSNATDGPGRVAS